jgi:N-sulfoglucosamine sulfohydrolase
MDRRAFLAQAATSVAAPMLAQRLPKNVLLLIADDLGLHTGAYGDKVAKTPNLDRLAGEGVRFTNAFCTTPSCSASRSVIHSGLHNHANGHYGHAHDFHNFSYLPFVKPCSALLKEAGYQTGVIGKMHVNPIDRFKWDLDSQGANRNVHGMADRARTFIQASAGRPWFLQIGYGDPHRAGDGFANRDYPGVKRTKFDPAKVQVPSFLPDNAATRAEVAEYYEASNRCDQGVGMMLDLLKETGQVDNTLVIFISDNGMPFPNAKTNLYDAGARLPMIVRAPGQSARGLVNEGFISWTDITPTILDWSGARSPEYPLHGRSFLPVLEQQNPAGWDQVFFSHTFHEVTMYYPIRGMRTKQFKYLRNLFSELEFPFASDLFDSKTWQSIRQIGETGMVGRRKASKYLHREPEELYDIQADPEELTNLTGRPEHRATIETMRAEVKRFRERTKDGWLINDNYK